MLRLILATWVVILNTSTITLRDTMLVIDNEAVKIGNIKSNESHKVEVLQGDSARLMFRLGENWIGTNLMELRDTINISDTTQTFELTIL